ncbi:MAG: ABC transporter permease [Candidatus Hermodarchaeota archaeon]
MVNITIKDLLSEKFRIILVILGIMVSLLMVHVGTGMTVGMVEQGTSLIDHAEYDVYIIQSNRENILNEGSVSDEMYEKVNSISGVEGVDKIINLWLGVEYKDEDEGVNVIALEKGSSKYLQPWNCIDCDASDIRNDNNTIVDRIILKFFPEVKVGSKLKAGQFDEKIKIKGFTENVQHFGNPVMWMNYDTAKRLFNLDNESTFLGVKLKSGYSAGQLKERLKNFNDEIKVVSAEDMKESTTDYILYDYGLIYSIGILAAMGFLVTIILIAITLYQSVVDKIPELVSMKALGASNGFINKILVSQTVLVVSVGFLLSVIIAILIAPQLTWFSAVPVVVNPLIAVILFGISLGLGIFCSMFSIRKVHTSDPAIIFRA